MKKKVFLTLLVMALLVVAFTVAVSAKDVDIGLKDVNGNAIIIPTEDADGDALTWYRITEAPADGTYYEYLDGSTTYYIVSVKTKDAAYVNDNYRVAYSYSGLKTGPWNGNIIATNLKGLTHADGKGPEYFNFVFESTPICYVYIPASFLGLQGTSGNSLKSLFYGCSSLVELEIESGSQITTLYTYGFYNDKKLKKLVLPENLKTIAYDAFNGLTIEITVPKSVTTFEESRWADFTIHYTGTQEDCAGWTYQPTKIDYVNHCDAYYGGAHQAGEEVDYIVSCARCGKAMYCVNPDHTIKTTVAYENYGKAGVLKEQCTECDVGAKETVVDALITFKGYSKNETNTSICVGYAINVDALKQYKSANSGVAFEYGAVIAVAKNVTNNTALVLENNKVDIANEKVIKASLESDIYSKLDVKIIGDFTGNEQTELLMSAYIYDGEKLVYIQGDKTETTQSEEIKPITIAEVE